MAHQSFGAVRVAAQREPLTFDFGMYGEETFTVMPEPSLGDCIELYEAPEPTPENLLDSARLLARFIERMVIPEDKARFRAALTRIPASECQLIIDCALWITEQVTGFPTTPPAVSASGRRATGHSSKARSAGRPHSPR